MDARLTAATILAKFDEGYEQWAEGSFEKAIKSLEEGVQLYEANPALLVQNKANLAPLVRARAALGFAEWRFSQELQATSPDRAAIYLDGSRKTLRALVTEFPDIEPSAADFAPDVLKYYRSIQRDVLAQQREPLTATVDEDGVMTFADGQLVGVGKQAITLALLPGVHHVLYLEAKEDAIGRQYTITITNAPRALSVRWRAASALWATPDGVELLLTSLDDRDAEAASAGQIASMTASQRVAVVDVVKASDKPAIRATLVNAAGKVVRWRTVPLDDQAAIIKLAKYLNNEVVPPQQVASVTPPNEPWWRDAYPALPILVFAGGAGIAADGIGGFVDRRDFFSRDTSIALVVSGGVCLVGGAIWFHYALKTSDRWAQSMPVAAVVPGGGFVGLAGRF